MLNKTYLVIGANGFVGSYIVDHLARHENVAVRAFDRFSRPTEFITRENIEIFKGDILSDIDLDNALKGVDYVLHSFSATTPFISDENPYIDISNNLERSVRIFELCVKHGVKKIGFVSSGGAVYGVAAEQGVVTEDTTPRPVSPYGINKLSIEHYLEYFKRKHGIDYTVYRLTNPYGPRQRVNKNQGVIPTFITKILDRDEITVLGDGSASRDYIYMDDAARMIADTLVLSCPHSVYNVGSGIQTTLNDIIDAIKSSTAIKEVKTTHIQAPPTFLERTSVSVQRYNEDFGPAVLTPFSEGIQKSLDWYSTTK